MREGLVGRFSLGKKQIDRAEGRMMDRDAGECMD